MWSQSVSAQRSFGAPRRDRRLRGSRARGRASVAGCRYPNWASALSQVTSVRRRRRLQDRSPAGNFTLHKALEGFGVTLRLGWNGATEVTETFDDAGFIERLVEGAR